MTPGYPRLLGDIGGTNARWAWQASAASPLEDVRSRPCAESPSVLDAARRYLAEGGHGQPRWAGIGIATPVTGDQVRMTNHPWAFSIAALREGLGVERCLVANDFTVLALSLPALGGADLLRLGGDEAVPGAPMALLGAGTGLGVSGLLRGADGRPLPLAGEGGHVTLAATDDSEAAILRWLRERLGHVSAERVLSGPGLVNLHEACRALGGRPAATAPEAPEPADIVERARSGQDDAAAQALRHFSGFLGNVAGNLALTLGARGGVFIGGGVVPRLGTAFDRAHFRERFEAKGRFRGYLAPIPVWMITASAPALVGASRALDDLADDTPARTADGPRTPGSAGQRP